MPTRSATRVTDYTAEEVNERIERDIDVRIAYYTEHPDQVARRLRELDEEWDIERVLETASSAMTEAPSMSVPSAETLSPASIRTTSPGTSSRLGIWTSFPSRMAHTTGEMSALSWASACSERYS